MAEIKPTAATDGVRASRAGVQVGSDDSIISISVPSGHGRGDGPDDAIMSLGIFPQAWEDEAQAPAPRALAAPLERWELPFGLRGIPVQFVAELWRDGETATAACPYGAAAVPDPSRPGHSWVIRLIDLVTGEVCLPLSPEQVAAWPGAPPTR